jgi:hypothetical protein
LLGWLTLLLLLPLELLPLEVLGLLLLELEPLGLVLLPLELPDVPACELGVVVLSGMLPLPSP